MTGDVQSIVWSTGSLADTLTINKAGQYSVAVTDTASCIARDTILVVESPLNTFRFPVDTAICSGSNFIVNLKTPSNTLVSWADGVNAGNRSVTDGQYKVTLQNKDCIIDHKMNFGSVPLPAFNLRADTSICQGFPVDLKVNNGATRYLWSTGNTSDRIMVKQEGIYWAEAYKDNCVYRDTFSLKVMQCDCNITMPNAFSPNNDGVNDTYRPLFKCYPIDYNFQIFSRYGQPLFKTIDTNVSWDGTSQKDPLPVGTYYYILSYYDLKERRIVKRSGGITLLK